MKQLVVISLGGSVVVPRQIDTKFLKNFLGFINKNLKFYRFIIVVGGGRTSREYTLAAKKIKKVNHAHLDWIGIYASRLNAELIKALLGKKVDRGVITDPADGPRFIRSVLIGAGSKPGWSTDYVAVQLAARYNANRVINLTNTSYVYDKDPKKHKSAKPIFEMTWRQLRKIVGNSWRPGLNMPFDPIACRFAQKSGLEAVVVGKNLTNLQKVLSNKSFKGTIVRGR